MAALVQTYPQQTTVTMLQSRPSSSGGYTPSQPQHLGSRNAPASRYNTPPTSGGYRGMPSHGPVAPYAFTSTPQLTNTNNLSRQHQNQSPNVRSENRASSAPTMPHAQQASQGTGAAGSTRHQHPNTPPISHSSSSTTLSLPTRSMDDSSISLRSAMAESSNRPRSLLELSASASLASANSMTPAKPSPDRYRRNVRRVDSSDSGPNRIHHASAMPSGSGMAAVGHLYIHPTQSNSSPSLHSFQPYRGTIYNPGDQTRRVSVDDMNLVRPQNAELAKRYRRRSLGNLETAGLNHAADAQYTSSPHPNAFIQPSSPAQLRDPRHQNSAHRPASSHAHSGSSDSVASARSGQSSQQQHVKNDVTSNTVNPQAAPLNSAPATKLEAKVVNAPPRTVDPNKRSNTPSPLSRPVNMTGKNSTPTPAEPTTSAKASVPQQPPVLDSPAAQQLAAVTQKDAKKSKSKLRRAFSFGSSSELRRASAQNNMEKSNSADPASKRKSKYEDELEPEQAKIAQKQEAGGLGESIYSGQGHFFTGSTDNLSISSTASSASIMLRKMGKGVKKSTRSLVGLFRPKSVVGVPAADGPVNHASTAQVSMVTVEAEREQINVNVNLQDQPGGGAGFSKFERNSIEAKNSVDGGSISNETRSRRSIVGGERERAEVLAAVKKGILKRNDSGQSSPVTRPLDYRAPDFNLPQIPHFNDSPHSSAPSTPKDDQPPRSGHRRTDSITVEGAEADYFSSIPHFASLDPKNNALLTPEGSASRNISFSPRIQFHDTWTSGEYDRRGEIATCNRLTPMLAQQIKEELNTFKMEMEVHESSKVYTHFF